MEVSIKQTKNQRRLLVGYANQKRLIEIHAFPPLHFCSKKDNYWNHLWSRVIDYAKNEHTTIGKGNVIEQ